MLYSVQLSRSVVSNSLLCFITRVQFSFRDWLCLVGRQALTLGNLRTYWSSLTHAGYLKLYELTFTGGSEVKASACNAGDLGSIPGLGRSPGEGNGNPLQYSCLKNPMDGGAWRAAVHGVTIESATTEHSTHIQKEIQDPKISKK